MKKSIKIKQLDDENKHLRDLLKQQIENSENLRVETQNTVETLKGEFDVLVKVYHYKGIDCHQAA
jgi:hypothetical protein